MREGSETPSAYTRRSNGTGFYYSHMKHPLSCLIIGGSNGKGLNLLKKRGESLFRLESYKSGN